MPYGDVRDRLLELPCQHGGTGYVTLDLFPPRFEIARALARRRARETGESVWRVFEFGALYGACLCSLCLGIHAAGGVVETVGWHDNETHTPGSNEACGENVRAVAPDAEIVTLRDLRPAGRVWADFDVVAVDGDHTYWGCYRDLRDALLMSPVAILVDDTVAIADVARAVADFLADHPEIEATHVRTVNGLCVLDPQPHGPDRLRYLLEDCPSVEIVDPVGALA